MSSLNYDMHSLCSTCRGGDCSYGNKCKECLSWSKEQFDIFVKHRKALVSKSKNRKKAKEAKDIKNRNSDRNSDNGERVMDPDGEVLGTSDSKALVEENQKLEVAKDTGGSLSRSDITNLVSQVLGDFSNQVRQEVASSLSNTYKDINALLDRRLGIEDNSNPSLSGNPLRPRSPMPIAKVSRIRPLQNPTACHETAWG